MLEVPISDHIKLCHVYKYDEKREGLQNHEVVSCKPSHSEHNVKMRS
jgi:hypothetical protein